MIGKLLQVPTERTRLRKLLVVVMLVSLLPLVVGLGILSTQLFNQQVEQTGEMVLARARAIRSAMDREFIKTHAVLKTLSNTDLWKAQQFSLFHAEAQQTAIDLGASSIVLIGKDGQMVLSTRRPYGTELPRLNSAPLLARTLSTGLPGISDLFVNPVDKQFIYTLAIPLRQEGDVKYSLNATFTPDALASILEEQKLPYGWRAAIIDKQGKIVCRTHEAARFTGRSVLPTLKEKLSGNGEGTYKDITLDGIPVMAAYSQSPFSHWSIVIGVPLAEGEATARHFITYAAVLLVITLAVGVAIIWWLSAYIAHAQISQSRSNKSEEPACTSHRN